MATFVDATLFHSVQDLTTYGVCKQSSEWPSERVDASDHLEAQGPTSLISSGIASNCRNAPGR
jgi:hypothetical protein